MARRRKTPQFYYNQQKQHTADRSRERVKRGLPPIEWLFTFETWWKVWEESGKWEKRGRRIGQYVMARHNDTGHYAPWNVSIVEAGINGSDGLKGWPEKKRARENGTSGFQPDRDQTAPQEEATLDANELGLAARTFIEIGRRFKNQAA